MAGVLKALDPISGEWVPISERGPQGIQGPLGPTGPQGPDSDELWVGTTLPSGPATDIWYDPSAPPAGPAGYATVPLAGLRINGTYRGGWTGSGNSSKTFTNVLAGWYIVMGQVTALSTVIGMRNVTVHLDGVSAGNSYLWFNTLNVHALMFPLYSIPIYLEAGDHVINFVQGTSVSSDGNDFGVAMLIPTTAP